MTSKSRLIFDIIEEITGVTMQQIRDKSRMRKYVDARRIYAVIMHTYSNQSLNEIGKAMMRTHPSIYHMTTTHKDIVNTDANYCELFQKVEQKYLDQVFNVDDTLTEIYDKIDRLKRRAEQLEKLKKQSA